MLRITEIELEKISDIDKYLLKIEEEEKFITLLRDMLKQLINHE